MQSSSRDRLPTFAGLEAFSLDFPTPTDAAAAPIGVFAVLCEEVSYHTYEAQLLPKIQSSFLLSALLLACESLYTVSFVLDPQGLIISAQELQDRPYLYTYTVEPIFRSAGRKCL